MKLPSITKQQQAILIFIYHYRFLNRIQIQAFLQHKNKRRINAWLPDLVEKDYLKRIYSRGFAENTKPAIYYLGPNGFRFIKSLGVKNLTELRKRYKEGVRKDSFIQQQLLLADIALAFIKKNTTSNGLHTLYTQTELAEEPFPFHFLLELNPSLLLLSETKKDLQAYLLELLPPTMPRYSIKKRIRTYLEFAESGQWESNADCPLPVILVLCPDKLTLIYTKRYVKKLKEEDQFPDDLTMWFATEDSVRKEGISSEVWEEVG